MLYFDRLQRNVILQNPTVGFGVLDNLNEQNVVFLDDSFDRLAFGLRLCLFEFRVNDLILFFGFVGFWTTLLTGLNANETFLHIVLGGFRPVQQLDFEWID